MLASKHRTSFALDDETVERIRRLAVTWNVSQAQVVRRSVKLASEQAGSDAREVRERLREYRTANRITAGDADRYLEQVARDRSEWGRDDRP